LLLAALIRTRVAVVLFSISSSLFSRRGGFRERSCDTPALPLLLNWRSDGKAQKRGVKKRLRQRVVAARDAYETRKKEIQQRKGSQNEKQEKTGRRFAVSAQTPEAIIVAVVECRII
jgi:hypothetical protein